MAKKSLISFCLFIALLLATPFVFAENNLGNEMQNSFDKAQNSVGNFGNAVGGAISDVTNNISEGFSSIMNDDKSTNGTMGVTTNRNTTNNMNNTNNGYRTNTSNSNTGTGTNTGTTGNYTATRTATSTNVNGTGLSDTAIIWIVLGITAVVIVALVWYYGTQENNRTKNNYNE